MEDRDTTNAQLIQQLTRLRLRLADLEAREADCQQERAHWKWTAELLRLMADFAYDWEYWISPEGQFQYVSPSCQRITGHTPDEFLQDPGLLLRLVHPDDRAAYRRHITHELADNDSAVFDFRIVTNTGEVRWIAHACQPMYDADGVFVGRRSTNRDITSAKRDELRNAELLAEYAHQEQFLDNLIQHASVGIAVVDREHRYLLVNPAYQSIPGTPDTPMVGRSIEEVFPGVPVPAIDMLDEVFRTGRPARLREYEAPLGSSRETAWWNVDHVPLLGADGSTRQVLVLTQDVSEQVRARQQIERLHAQMSLDEAELRAVFRSVGEGLVIADLAGQVLAMNAAALELLGDESEGQAHRHFSEFATAFSLTDLDDRPIPLEEWPMSRVLRGERFANYEARLRHLQSGKTWIGSYSGSLARGADGEPLVAILTVQDVTARHEAAQERERLVEKLRAFAEELEAQNEKLIDARRALEAERRRYQSLFEDVPDGYLVTDLQGVIHEANQVAATLLGAPVDALAGSQLTTFVVENQETSFQAILEQLQRSGRTHTFELEIRPLRGNPFPASVTVAAVTDGERREDGLRWLIHDISQRVGAEQALRKSETRFRQLAETSTFGLLIGDEAGRIHYANKTIQSLLGYTEQELLSGEVRWSDLILPEHVERYEQAWVELQATGRCTPYEKAFVARDGHPVPVLVGASALEMSPQGEPLVAMFVTDLTALKQSEADLAEERALLKAIFDNAPEGIIVADAQARLLMTNAAADRLYARPVPYGQDWSSHATLQLCYPDGRLYDPRDLPLTRSALDGETLTGLEMGIIWPDGQQRNLLINTAPVRDDAGRITGAVGVFQDITARKREQEERTQLLQEVKKHAEALRVQNEALSEMRLALARERDVLQAIMENTHAHLAYLDTEFRFVRVNSAYARQSGYTVEQLIGRKHFDLFPDAENEAIFRKVRDTGEPVRFEARPFVYVNQPGRGTTYWDWALVPVKNDAGQVDGLVFSLLDVTERERAGQALRERESQLEELNETLEQRVTERTALAEERASQLRALAVELTQAEERERRRLAQNLHDNLQQLLAAAKISVNILQEQLDGELLRPLMGQIDTLLGESIATSRSLTTELSSPILYDAGLGAALCALGRQTQERHHLSVVVEVDPEAEPEAEPVRVLLFQAVRELLFNVVKHAHATQAYVHMLCEPEDQVCIIVGDDGVGFSIPPKKESNQGFGLFSIRERLELMGGSMVIDSVPGQGTHVRLYAPIHQEPSVPHMGAAEGEEAPAPVLSREAVIQQIMSLEAMDAIASAPLEESPPADVIRVLLVDDHEIMREGLASLLMMEEGIEIMAQAPDGETAVELAKRLKPDIVVMDVSLPGISGVEATRRILAADDHVAVIGLSMHEQGPIAQAMRDAGAVAYLTKGGPSDALIAAIRSSAGKSREDGANKPKNAAEDAAHS
ncbi:MAG: PAS domain S-box protein [Chloroflexi bacterium]|nr:PAS domain S-box protein [Chloroflexota bacterium]